MYFFEYVFRVWVLRFWAILALISVLFWLLSLTPKNAKEVLLEVIVDLVAVLANSSAFSFPIISEWPRTQAKVILAFRLLIILDASIALICWLCPGLFKGVLSLKRAAWLSEKTIKLSPSFAVLLAYSIAYIIASSSPLYINSASPRLLIFVNVNIRGYPYIYI